MKSITNQKCARNVKRTIKTSDMALLIIELVESFAILDALIECEFPLTYCSLLHTRGNCVSLVYTTAICHFIAA